MSDKFDFRSWHQRFPEHWDDHGWPTVQSTWRSRRHPHLRVRVSDTIRREHAAEGSQLAADLDAGTVSHGDVETAVFWDGSLEELHRLFTYTSTERWNIDRTGFVYGSGGIDRDGRWRDEGGGLGVVFDRSKFGGPDTWHRSFEDQLPFFEPISDSD